MELSKLVCRSQTVDCQSFQSVQATLRHRSTMIVLLGRCGDVQENVAEKYIRMIHDTGDVSREMTVK